jgi:hypothetical protein
MHPSPSPFIPPPSRTGCMVHCCAAFRSQGLPQKVQPKKLDSISYDYKAAPDPSAQEAPTHCCPPPQGELGKERRLSPGCLKGASGHAAPFSAEARRGRVSFIGDLQVPVARLCGPTHEFGDVALEFGHGLVVDDPDLLGDLRWWCKGPEKDDMSGPGGQERESPPLEDGPRT